MPAPASVSPDTLPDPELEALPEPRRPVRTLTLVTLAVCACAALLLSFGLRHDVAYALRSGAPTDIGTLETFTPTSEHANRWVRASGALLPEPAVRYRRPLEPMTYRLSRVAGNPRVWVQITVPEAMEGPHFIPPTSFVGRLMPVSEGGIRARGLRDAMATVAGETPVEGDYLLVDNESPGSLAWVLGLVGLFGCFAVFNVWGFVHLMRPVRDV